MNTRAETFFDRSNRALDFADMTIGRDDVQLDRSEFVVDAVEFVVTVYVADVESAVLVQGSSVKQLLEDHRRFAAVGNRENSAEPKVSGNGVKKDETLDIKKMTAQGNVSVAGVPDRGAEWGRLRT